MTRREGRRRPDDVKAGLTPKRTRRLVENDEYAAFVGRVLRAYSCRVGDGCSCTYPYPISQPMVLVANSNRPGRIAASSGEREVTDSPTGRRLVSRSYRTLWPFPATQSRRAR